MLRSLSLLFGVCFGCSSWLCDRRMHDSEDQDAEAKRSPKGIQVEPLHARREGAALRLVGMNRHLYSSSYWVPLGIKNTGQTVFQWRRLR